MKSAFQTITYLNLHPRALAWTLGLTTFSILAPALFAHTPNNQWITGTLVNLALFLAAWRLPLGNALPVALLPSSIALMQGLLPLSLAPFLPVIIASNILLIYTFGMLRDKPIAGIIAASMAKFILLLCVSLILSGIIISPLLVILQVPQFITALAGGCLFLLIHRLSGPYKKIAQ